MSMACCSWREQGCLDPCWPSTARSKDGLAKGRCLRRRHSLQCSTSTRPSLRAAFTRCPGVGVKAGPTFAFSCPPHSRPFRETTAPGRIRIFLFVLRSGTFRRWVGPSGAQFYATKSMVLRGLGFKGFDFLRALRLILGPK